MRLVYVNDTVGWGLFARRPFAEGDYLFEYTGVRFPRGMPSPEAQAAYAWELGDGSSIVAFEVGNAARLMNHFVGIYGSPNVQGYKVCEPDGEHVVFKASRALAAGDQLCIDYGPQFVGDPFCSEVFFLNWFLMREFESVRQLMDLPPLCEAQLQVPPNNCRCHSQQQRFILLQLALAHFYLMRLGNRAVATSASVP